LFNNLFPLLFHPFRASRYLCVFPFLHCVFCSSYRTHTGQRLNLKNFCQID
jgi:hypothetical protein